MKIVRLDTLNKIDANSKARGSVSDTTDSG